MAWYPYAQTELFILLQGLAQTRRSVTMAQLLDTDSASTEKLLILRCDVERNVLHAFEFAKQAAELGIKVSFYFHTRKEAFVPSYFSDFQALGHEVGYHHECLDRANGDFEAARKLFLQEVEMFRRAGCPLETVCAHGEAGLPKEGYTYTYDLFSHFPDLLSQAGVRAEVYLELQRRPHAHVSDVFSAYSQFFKKAGENAESPGLLHILIHPHRWHSSSAPVFIEIAQDLWQTAKNKLVGHRSYEIVTHDR